MKKMMWFVPICLIIFSYLNAMQDAPEDDEKIPLICSNDLPDDSSIILIDKNTGVVPTAVFYQLIDAPKGFNKWACIPASSLEEQKILERYRSSKLLVLYDKDRQILALGTLALLPVDLNDCLSIDQYVQDHLLDHSVKDADSSQCLLM
jgi:hypothetical protein